MLSLLLLQAASAGWYQSSVQGLEIASKAGILLPREGMRDLSVRVTSPVSGGPYPVIVFSHGMYGSETGSDPLVKLWASSGYIVVQPTHDDSLKYADAETRRKALRGNLDNIGSAPQRPKDISLVYDSLPTIMKEAGELKASFDQNKVGLGGHSFGAWTTQVVSGMTGRVGGSSGKDDRFQSFLVISPSGEGGNITSDSFKGMKGPMMMISGDNDKGRGDWDPKVHRRQAFEVASPGDKWLVWIKEAHHGFGGINGRQGDRVLLGASLGGEANPTHVKQVQSASLAFWDSTLKGRPEASYYLKNKTLEESGGVAISYK